jgi:hypothetical protein
VFIMLVAQNFEYGLHITALARHTLIISAIWILASIFWTQLDTISVFVSQMWLSVVHSVIWRFYCSKKLSTVLNSFLTLYFERTLIILWVWSLVSHHEGKVRDWGCLRMEQEGEYFDLRERGCNRRMEKTVQRETRRQLLFQWSDQEGKMGWICSTHGIRNAYCILDGNPHVKRPLRRLGLDGRTLEKGS